jgi:hypothetical protein
MTLGTDKHLRVLRWSLDPVMSFSTLRATISIIQIT